MQETRIHIVQVIMNLQALIIIKGTVSVISSDPSCKESNARFTMNISNLNLNLIENVENNVFNFDFFL